ncbi:MAG TPA: hypothetical protein VGF86_05170 [Candidatus Tumulicola sp.]|jgi:hypothetical protein
MKRPSERVFTVRIWSAAAPSGSAWRGAVYDVATGKTSYVVDLQEISTCVAAAMDVTPGADDN